LPVAQRDALGNVFDGNFVMPFSGDGFGWRVTNSVDANIHVAALPNGGGNALVIDFQDTRMAFHNVTQLLALGPGRYMLRGKAQADHLDTPRGLQWVLSCAEGRHLVLAESQLLVGSQTWREFEVPFEIAPSGCGGQWLRLQMGAPDRINGRAAYAGLNVERAPTAAP